jgi:hypothetical protein
MARAPKKADKPPEYEVQFETYVDEVLEIAERVMRRNAGRAREIIRSEVEKYVGSTGVCAKCSVNRRQAVERALAIGVTKMLEAWDYTALNKAWPPEEG